MNISHQGTWGRGDVGTWGRGDVHKIISIAPAPAYPTVQTTNPSPQLAIHPPILNRFGQMQCLNLLNSGEIGNRACQFKYPRKTTRRQAKLIRYLLQELITLFIQPAEPPDMPGLHLAVGVEAEGGQAIALDLARLVDSLTDGDAVFGGGLIGEVLVRHARHFDMQIDAIEEGTGKAATIAMEHGWGAGTVMC